MAIFRNGQKRSTAGVAATIVGGSIHGLCAALDLADAGLKISLLDHRPCPGGRATQLGFMLSRHNGMLRRDASDHGYGCTRPSISPATIHHNQHLNMRFSPTS
jgi:monoamine oxidase